METRKPAGFAGVRVWLRKRLPEAAAAKDHATCTVGSVVLNFGVF